MTYKKLGSNDMTKSSKNVLDTYNIIMGLNKSIKNQKSIIKFPNYLSINPTGKVPGRRSERSRTIGHNRGGKKNKSRRITKKRNKK